MAAKAMNKYLIEATFQTKKNNVHTMKMEIEAVNADAVWKVLRDTETAEQETMLHARVMRIDNDTGEAVIIRPKPVPSLPHLPEDTAPVNPREWYSDEKRFGVVDILVYKTPCTYKTGGNVS